MTAPATAYEADEDPMRGAWSRPIFEIIGDDDWCDHLCPCVWDREPAEPAYRWSPGDVHL